MHFYRPKFVLAALQEPQDRLLSKLGGHPWGFPKQRWPVCPDCGCPESMVAQLEHAPPMIDLGETGGVLHLFHCANLLCQSWGADGCHAILLRREEIGSGLTLQPPDKDGDQVINGELWITGWEHHEDSVSPDLAPLFYDDARHMELPNEIANPSDFWPQWRTKAGGVPYWGGNGVTLDHTRIPCPPFEFLLQIHETVYVDGLPPAADVVGCDVSVCEQVGEETKWEHTTPGDRPAQAWPNSPMSLVYEKGDESYGADFVNFGSDGTGYVFINRHSNPPEVRWFWSR